RMNLQGFTSDAPSMIDLFRNEARLCRQAVDPVLADGYPDSMIRYFDRLLAGYGMQALFRNMMDDDGGAAWPAIA
ncbi:MAG TPA: hypothetical protein VLT88_15775, partial [Desulfosarcina sp.]|nr:hypothetical protein [Desulfosarcina sp.]